jgi:hypothetical protein
MPGDRATVSASIEPQPWPVQLESGCGWYRHPKWRSEPMTTSLTPTDALVEEFLARAAVAPPPGRKRLIVAIDATASRQPTWDLAAQHQGAMFAAAAQHGGLDVQLVYFRGQGELKATGWFAHSTPLVNAMAGVVCRAGITQWGRVLGHAVKEHRNQPVAAVVLIGDTCEEHASEIQPHARELGQLKVPAYCFHEGDCPIGQYTFGLIAAATGGAVLPFDSSSASRLRELLAAVAAYVAGGVDALAGQSPEIVAFLTHGGSHGR